MKKYIATFAICLGLAYGAAATAADLGNGISAGADLDVNYTTGTEAWVYKLTPELSMATPWGVGLSADTAIMLDDVEFTGINWEASMMAMDNLEVYGKIKSDADHDFGDVTMGLTLSF